MKIEIKPVVKPMEQFKDLAIGQPFKYYKGEANAIGVKISEEFSANTLIFQDSDIIPFISTTYETTEVVNFKINKLEISAE